MYSGMAIFMVGEWLLFGSYLQGAIRYLLIYAACVLLFVLLYEEPTLRRKFPADYQAYFSNVPRFIPQLRPWMPEKSKGAASSER
jgi:protein-S-isoprenylcysteine O-methyltransferase Ste14